MCGRWVIPAVRAAREVLVQSLELDASARARIAQRDTVVRELEPHVLVRAYHVPDALYGLAEARRDIARLLLQCPWLDREVLAALESPKPPVGAVFSTVTEVLSVSPACRIKPVGVITCATASR